MRSIFDIKLGKGAVFRVFSKLLPNILGITRVSGLRTTLAFIWAITISLPEIFRSGSLVAADRKMSMRRWPFALQGVSFTVDGRLFSGGWEMYCRQVYFPTPAFDLKPGTTVVDLGANVGMFSILAGIAGCRVLAVEAQSEFARRIHELAVSYGVDERIAVENALIGPGTGLFSDSAALACASICEGTAPPTISMVYLLDKYGADQVDFLKVDIEGSEFDLFDSCDRWLPRVRRIAMEVHDEFGSVSGLRDVLCARGYSVELRDSTLRVVSSVSKGGGYLYAIRHDGA